MSEQEVAAMKARQKRIAALKLQYAAILIRGAATDPAWFGQPLAELEERDPELVAFVRSELNK